MPAHMGKTCERMQAIRVQHARKTSQNARAHTVRQKMSYKNARAHADFEWKGPPPPVEGEKKGEREEEKRKETKKKEKE